MVNIDDNTHEMTVTAGSPGDVLTVHVLVFATAGEQCDPPGTDGCDNKCMLPNSFSADACADATPISGADLFGFDNTAATLDSPGHLACVAPANQDNYEDNMAADVWRAGRRRVTAPSLWTRVDAPRSTPKRGLRWLRLSRHRRHGTRLQ